MRFIDRFLVGALIVMGFAAFCGTAFGQEVDTRHHGAIITGILHDGTNPVLSTEVPGARVTIYRRNGEWNEFVATTDCDNDRGCVAGASGRFWFLTDQNGNIIRPGRVIISVTYDRPLVGQFYENVSKSSPYLELTFEYELRPGINDLGILPVEALVRLKTDRSKMSNPSGGLLVPIEVTNRTKDERVVVTLKAQINAVGPTGWTSYSANLGVVELAPGQVTERSLFVPLTEIGVVNGFGVYGVIDAVDYANPWRSFGKVYFSVPKYN